MTGLSVLTLVKGRAGHLANLVEGLRRSATPPGELVVVDMNVDPLARPDANFPVRIERLGAEALPLAAARNLAARSARHDALMFLDVDCIPARGLVSAMTKALEREDAVICPEVFYLPPGQPAADWREADLVSSGAPHPVRPFPKAGLAIEPNPGLFWSLAFGMRRARFAAFGGFDEAFSGYGAEDTDFGFRAEKAGLPLLLMAGPGAFHQYHEIEDPPVRHLADIVRNAAVFRAKWGVWPMQGWLEGFERLGLIRLRGGTIEPLERNAIPAEAKVR